MGFPDRIEREVHLAHPVGRVWEALTTSDGLSAWFGERASIDLHPGGDAEMVFANGLAVPMRVERVEPERVFGFTWKLPDLPVDDPRRTYVEFTLDPVGEGTQLRVTETGFAQLPDEIRTSAYDSHAEGWKSELGELVEYLGGV